MYVFVFTLKIMLKIVLQPFSYWARENIWFRKFRGWAYLIRFSVFFNKLGSAGACV